MIEEEYLEEIESLAVALGLGLDNVVFSADGARSSPAQTMHGARAHCRNSNRLSL